MIKRGPSIGSFQMSIRCVFLVLKLDLSTGMTRRDVICIIGCLGSR